LFFVFEFTPSILSSFWVLPLLLHNTCKLKKVPEMLLASIINNNKNNLSLFFLAITQALSPTLSEHKRYMKFVRRKREETPDVHAKNSSANPN
jgi:hypothetical protein